MKKDLGVVEAVFPMPVLVIAAYDENGTVNVMNAAWGQICDFKQIALFLDEGHKTTENILKTKALESIHDNCLLLMWQLRAGLIGVTGIYSFPVELEP